VRALLAAVALCLAGPALAGQAMPAPAFRDRMAAAFRAATGEAATTVDDRTFRAKARDGREVTVSIDNAYAAYVADPSQLDALIARYVRVFTAPGDDGAPIDRLVVIVRPSDYATRGFAPGTSPPPHVPPRPMAGDLSYFLAVDSPDAIRLATPADLARWKVDEGAAWTRGIANIGSLLGAMQLAQLAGYEDSSGLVAASGLAPSVLADPAMCAGTRLPGADLVLVNARDMFLFASAAHAEDFWKVARAEIAAGRSLSATVLTCRDGRWAVAEPPAE
jgi:hypothetical protein